jgi:hypothetical protein
MDRTAVNGLKTVDNDATMSKGDSNQKVANDASKERQKTLIKDSNTNDLKTVIGMKKVDDDAKMRKDNTKPASTNALKQRKKQLIEDNVTPTLMDKSEDNNTNDVKNVIGLKKLGDKDKMRKDNIKKVANDASKECQKKLIKIIDKPSLKKQSDDIDNKVVRSKTNKSTSQKENNVSIFIVL